MALRAPDDALAYKRLHRRLFNLTQKKSPERESERWAKATQTKKERTMCAPWKLELKFGHTDIADVSAVPRDFRADEACDVRHNC